MPGEHREEPAFSVVVPTRSRPEQLGRCLRALLALEPAGGPTELIIVDDDPAGGAAATLDGIAEVRVGHSAGRGPAAARNAGIALARGRRIAFTDDDCEPAPEWLRGFASALDGNPGTDAAVGTTVNGEDGLCSRASHLVVEALQGTSRAGDGPSFAPTNNVCFPRQPLVELGGFDERFPRAGGEDRDLSERWLDSDRRFVEAPDAVLVHRHRLSLAGFWRQHRNYGHGAFAFHHGAPRRGHPRLVARPDFFRALRAGLGEAAGGHRLRVAGLVAVSQLASAWGYLRAATGAIGSAGDDRPLPSGAESS